MTAQYYYYHSSAVVHITARDSSELACTYYCSMITNALKMIRRYIRASANSWPKKVIFSSLCSYQVYFSASPCSGHFLTWLHKLIRSEAFLLLAHCTLRKFTHYLGFLHFPKDNFLEAKRWRESKAVQITRTRTLQMGGCDISNPTNLRNL